MVIFQELILKKYFQTQICNAGYKSKHKQALKQMK